MTDTDMRVMELPAHGAPLRAARRPVPQPEPGHVRVRVEACGVCGSDVFLQDGGFATSPVPIVPGHEAAGTIDALGAGVDGLEVGSRVALYYLSTPPGDAWALAGAPNRSPNVRRMGVDVDGAFAQYVTRPVESVIVPPGDLPAAELAVLTDAVATPLHALRRVARLREGETVAVIGVGGLGSNAIQLTRAFGARPLAISRSREKLELAMSLGAEAAIASDDQVEQRVRDLTRFGADVVLQCADSPDCYELALRIAGPGGRVVAVGSTARAFRVEPMRLIWSELALLGSRGFVPADIEEAIELRLRGAISLDHLVREIRPLEEAQAALDDLRAGRVLRSVLAP